MSHQETLEKAIKLAIDNGWQEQGIKWMFQLHELADLDDFDMENHNNFNVLIYNHEFAKALWGEDGGGLSQGGTGRLGWQDHLSRMVVADDPIQYLSEHLTSSV